MKKIIVIALATIAIAATALIAVPALAKDSPPQAPAVVQAAAGAAQSVPATITVTTVVTQPALSAATGGLYMGYGAAFCGGGLALGDTVTLQRVATTLGITYDQLVQDMDNGQTIAAIAQAQNVPLSSVVSTVVAAQTDMVNVLVKYGYLTQDQANTIIADLSARVKAALSATPVAGYTGYGYGCFGITSSVTPGTTTVPGTSYGYGMMGY